MLRVTATTLAFSTLVTIILALPTNACEGHSYVRVALDPLPVALRGVGVQLAKTVAQQIVIDNPTTRMIEVLDERGLAFVRVGPKGTAANLGARAWYMAQSPGAVVPSSVTRDSQTQWKEMSRQAVFAWFDPRLETVRVRLSPETLAQPHAVDVGSWEIPLRVDGERVVLSGRFRYEPPAGAYSVQLTSPRQLVPGVQVTLLPGPAPGLMLRNQSGQAVTVFGEAGEPFLRFTSSGVDANVRSPTWWRTARSQHDPPGHPSASAAPEWVRVAAASRFSWIEPRAGQVDQERRHDWSVPVAVGEVSAQITGTGSWKPF